LVTRAARDEQESDAGIGARPYERAEHLVERVVSSDVLAHDDQRSVRGRPRRRVDRVRLVVERLLGAERLAGAPERVAQERHTRTHETRLAQRLIDDLDAAETAARAPHDRASARSWGARAAVSAA